MEGYDHGEVERDIFDEYDIGRVLEEDEDIRVLHVGRVSQVRQ